ncbi:ParA family protein, partial [Alistipes sp.]|uniref:ParA family protein n=1 Tax=Alistipes sp. TaxID=1872444 RepID=UPI0039774B5E
MMESVNISICNQKGGVGKSSLTVLLASYLHYTLGHDVLVMDCDYQSSDMRAVG